MTQFFVSLLAQQLKNKVIVTTLMQEQLSFYYLPIFLWCQPQHVFEIVD